MSGRYPFFPLYPDATRWEKAAELRYDLAADEVSNAIERVEH
jgi:hypothetical protein